MLRKIIFSLLLFTITCSAYAGELEVENLSLNNLVLTNSNLTESMKAGVSRRVKLGLYYPDGFTESKAWPLVFVMQDRDTSLKVIDDYKRMADEMGFVLAAIEVKNSSNKEATLYCYALDTIRRFRLRGLLADKPILIGGFSKGAGLALRLGVWGGDLFSGILAIGYSQDIASSALQELNNSSSVGLPICFVNGRKDQKAAPYGKNAKAMFDSMDKSGFKNRKLIVYDDAHVLPYKETKDAIDWLLYIAEYKPELVDKSLVWGKNNKMKFTDNNNSGTTKREMIAGGDKIVKLKLKTGTEIEGLLIDMTDIYYKVDQGAEIPITYFIDDIENVEYVE